MAENDALRDPWLVAVWPGMGNVALLAGSYLLQQVRALPVGELEAREFFELQNVEVTNGITSTARTPRCLFFEWRDPKRRHDLLIFVGEAQPNTGGYALCEQLLDYATSRGVKRFFTFAAMATQLSPGDTPRVFAVATDEPTLGELKRLNVEVMTGGQISGLNGVLLAAGADRGLRGACLLGELPFYAVGVPNPRASKAVLERFVELAGLDVDFGDLEQQADAVDEQMQQLLEQMQSGAGEGGEFPPGRDDDEDDDADEATPTAAAGASATPAEPKLDPKVRRRIETLFERARKDRSTAMELKHELDRLGVFKQFEDRFLDLFRKAE